MEQNQYPSISRWYTIESLPADVYSTDLASETACSPISLLVSSSRKTLQHHINSSSSLHGELKNCNNVTIYINLGKVLHLQTSFQQFYTAQICRHNLILLNFLDNWRAAWKNWTSRYISFFSTNVFSMVFYFRCSVYWWKGSVRF